MRTTYIRAASPDSGERTIGSVFWAVPIAPFDTDDSDLWPYERGSQFTVGMVVSDTARTHVRSVNREPLSGDQAEAHGYGDCFGAALHAQRAVYRSELRLDRWLAQGQRRGDPRVVHAICEKLEDP
jgi:hypothetical protein